MSGSERYDTDSTATPRPILSRWFLPLLAVIAAGTTLLFIGFVSDDPLVSALFQGAFALVLAGVLFVVGYRYFTTTPLSKTKARTVALWTLAGFGLFVTMNVWFRFQAFVSGAPVEPEFAVSTSLTAGVLSGAVVGIAVARGHRRQAERERALADYREIFEQAEDGIVIHDPETREIAEINERGAEILGYPVEELEGTSIDAIYADDPDFSHEQAIERMQRALDGKPQQFDWLVERKDGTTVWVEVSLKRSTIGGEDRLIAIIRDVTERREREQELEARATAMAASMDGMATLDGDGRYIYATEAHADVYGYDDPEAFVGEHWHMCYDDEEIQAFEEEVLPALERDGQWRGEATGTRCDGSQFPQELTLTALENGGLVCVVRDITERTDRRRELERQNERLEQFASVLSHDLRNPLGVAEGYLELARDTGADEDFERIEHAHDRMERIVEDVLTLARQGKGISDTSTVDLASVAERAWSNVETDDAELSIGEDGCLGTIEADESRLEQLLENLFRNAIEHGGEGTTARVDRSSSGFLVEDDGPGIPVDEREQVFEHGHTTSENGTGFGLSIVETIAESHGWEISVGEGADGGARFEIGLGDAVRIGTDGLFADG